LNCLDVDNLLQDFIDGELSDSDDEMIVKHHEICPECAQKHQDVLSVVAAMKTLAVPRPSVDFVERIITEATGNRYGRLNRFTPQVTGGIAASFLIFFALVLTLFGPDSENHDGIPTLIGKDVKFVKLVIESKQALEGIRVSISVSDNLVISGYGVGESISWVTSLNKGTNVISLPVFAIASGDGEITTRLRINEAEKVFRVETVSKPQDQVSQDQFLIVDV